MSKIHGSEFLITLPDKEKGKESKRSDEPRKRRTSASKMDTSCKDDVIVSA